MMQSPGVAGLRGFTLTELAIVLLIVALLIGGLLVPLSSQVDLRNTNDTNKSLSEIREALLGFAIINGRLPCPDTDNPGTAGYGEENSPCASPPSTEGFLPWKTLGVKELDAWGSPNATAIRPQPGDWRYRVDRNFAVTFNLSTLFDPVNLEIFDSSGYALTTTTERPVAIIFSAGQDLVPNGYNATFDQSYQGGERSGGFDDITMWISRPILFNRMVAAGKLP